MRERGRATQRVPELALRALGFLALFGKARHSPVEAIEDCKEAELLREGDQFLFMQGFYHGRTTARKYNVGDDISSLDQRSNRG